MRCGSGATASTRCVLGLRFEELPKAEVVALELRIAHLAVAAEIDAIEATAKSLDKSVRQLRGELREHRAPQLEPFVGEVAAVVVIINHHQRPRAGDEVAAGKRSETSGFDCFERLGRRVDAAEPRIDAGLTAALFPGG